MKLKHKWQAWLGMGALVAGLVAGCGSSSPASPSASGSSSSSPQKLTSVSIEIDGSAVPYYAPLYAAQERGYFKQHGLNVKFLYGNAAEITKNVAVNNVTFGFPNADDVIAAYAQGLPVKVVDTTYQHGIGALIYLKGSGISSPKDLAGKSVAITSYGSPNYIQLQVMLKKAGVPLSSVHVKIIGTGSIVNALTAHQVDAIDFSMLRTYALQAQGVPAEQILSDKYLPDHGNVLITSNTELKQDPQAVKAFIAALHQGIQWVSAGNEAAAVKLSLKYAPSFANQATIDTKILKQVYVDYLWNGPDTKAHGLGYGNLSAWQTTINTLAQYKVISHSFSAKNLVVEPSSIK